MGQFLGLRSVVYGVPALAEARDWYARVLQQEPCRDSDTYVAFEVGGYELGLDPDARSVTSRADGVVAYWAVNDIAAAVERLNTLGARQHSETRELGDGSLAASFLDPFGNIFGLLEQPHTASPEPAVGENDQ